MYSPRRKPWVERSKGIEPRRGDRMGHSLASVHIHFIFSTKNRLSHLKDNLHTDIFAYLGGIARELGAKPVIIVRRRRARRRGRWFCTV